MRFEVALELEESSEKLEIPWQSADPERCYHDLREQPNLIALIEEARTHPPLRGFLTLVNGPDSLFSTARCKTWPGQPDPSSGGETSEFSSQIDLVFAPETFNYDLGRYEDLAKRLQELLAREASPDALWTELRVRRCHFRKLARWGFCLAVFLHARGFSREQAELRWGLGLARIQQALLFTSRALRHEIAQEA